jgi:hypothetical protein
MADGNLVQAYWSDNDKAFIVPDGSTQRFALTWTGVAPDGLGQFQLGVRGDQVQGNPDDVISVGQSTDPGQPNGVRVTMNGEAVQFDEGRITSVVIDAKTGQNTITSNPPPGVTVNTMRSLPNPAAARAVTRDRGAAGIHGAALGADDSRADSAAVNSLDRQHAGTAGHASTDLAHADQQEAERFLPGHDQIILGVRSPRL